MFLNFSRILRRIFVNKFHSIRQLITQPPFILLLLLFPCFYQRLSRNFPGFSQDFFFDRIFFFCKILSRSYTNSLEDSSAFPIILQRYFRILQKKSFQDCPRIVSRFLSIPSHFTKMFQDSFRIGPGCFQDCRRILAGLSQDFSRILSRFYTNAPGDS